MLPAFTEAGSGPALVLLHGMPFDSSMWSKQAVALRDSYRVITPDLRGFGASPLGSDAPELSLLAGDVVELLDYLQIESAVLGGASMGGYVVMELLRSAPQRCHGLVFAGTKASADSATERAGRLATIAAIEDSGTTEFLHGGFAEKLLHAGLPAALADQLRRYIDEAAPAAVVWGQRAMAARADYFDALADVGVPSLVVVGEHDKFAPPAEAERLAAALPNAQLVQIPGVGHLPNLETSSAFNVMLAKFLHQLY